MLRTVDCDVTLPDGVRLRPGTRCMLPFFAAFRAPWIDHPDEYRPERWAPDAPQRKQLEASITPFACAPPLFLHPPREEHTHTIVGCHVGPVRYRAALWG